MKQAKENCDLSTGRYKVGVGDPIELREAQVQYQDAQLTYCQTLYEYNVAKANLEKAMGRNIASGEIELEKPAKKHNVFQYRSRFSGLFFVQFPALRQQAVEPLADCVR